METSTFPILLFLFFTIRVSGIELPGSCKSGQYYDPGDLTCQSCPTNASMVTSSDGFSCACQDHSVPSGSGCRPCNVTDVLSADRRSCVPRRCQTVGGRVICRKCPADYITVTQNPDGSPTKEVQCVKCARGYKPLNNVCVPCESCTCTKQEVVVRGRCVPKKFLNERHKHEKTKMHPNELLDIVKLEYFCGKNDALACRELASECVRAFYDTDLAGACRLWIQPKMVPPKDLPKLTIEATLNEKDPGEIGLSRGMNTINLVQAVYTSNGGLKFLYNQTNSCSLPMKLVIGKDFSKDCILNVSELNSSLHETLAPFLSIDSNLKALPVILRKTNGQYVQRAKWPSNRFRRYFLIDQKLSIVANMTNTIYLRTLLIKLQIERNKLMTTSLQLHLAIEAQYATKSPLAQTVTTTLRVEHEMPNAGVLRGLEIWGGVLGALLSLYAVAQWRGALRRGGLQFTLVPLLASAIADTLYFAAIFSTLHALAAEAGTLGITLPLSRSEEQMVKAFIYSAVALKALKVAWVNWSQCRCDMFFLDWSEYNPPTKEVRVFEKNDNWKASTLAREWERMQTKRRACPAYTATLALVFFYLMRPWQDFLPDSQSYKWALVTLAWWCSYVVMVSSRWVSDRVMGSPTSVIPKVCTSVGLSLLVFQEEFYAHYVHGRNDESEARSLIGPLAVCRVVCAPQLRAVYKQLSAPGLGGLGEKDSKKVLLSKFLAAFFERALDGLSWVASERTVPERLLDVELVARESGNTSALLYDPINNTPSCFAVTWWGEEWTLGTFDAMLFGCLYIVFGDILLAALITLAIWRIMKSVRAWFGIKNQIEKTEVEI